jgi:23S rRNA pseudoU1915 N3-methylase RlmH
MAELQPIEAALEALLAEPQALRDRVAAQLIDLMLQELFDFKTMQTDPNLANFRYDPTSGRIVLLDFGAVTRFDPQQVEGFRTVLRAGLAQDRTAAEAALLERAIPAGAVVCTLDERGALMSSPAFADKLAGWRDAGRGDLALIIGGADGIAPELRSRADASLSFGKMVWPHMLVRVMLAEQLYRAASILAGSPYHRV